MTNILEMSPTIAAQVPSQICNIDSTRAVNDPDTPAGNQSFTGLLQGGEVELTTTYSAAYLYIMKGTVPADLSTLVNPQVRSSDQLIMFTTHDPVGGNSRYDFTPTDLTVNPILINTNYKTATAAGTATWFWLIVGPNSTTTVGAIGTTITHQVIGTVGVTGSGTDLQISNVNITVGESLRLTNFKIAFPTSWSF